MPRPKLYTEEELKERKKKQNRDRYHVTYNNYKVICEICDKRVYKYAMKIHEQGLYHKYKELKNKNI